MECQKVNHRKLKPLSTECDTGGDKRLSRGCSNLMYACQQGLTDNIVKELRKKVNIFFFVCLAVKKIVFYKWVVLICMIGFYINDLDLFFTFFWSMDRLKSNSCLNHAL